MATIQLPYPDSASLDPTLVVALAVDALANGYAPNTEPAPIESSIGEADAQEKPDFNLMPKTQLLAYCQVQDPVNADRYAAMLKDALLIEAEEIWEELYSPVPL